MAGDNSSSNILTDYLSLGFKREDFYNVSLSVSVIQCSSENDTRLQSNIEVEEPLFNSWDFALSQFLEPWSSDAIEPFTEPDVESEQERCNQTLQTTWNFSVYPAQILDFLLAVLLLLILLPALYCVFRVALSRIRSLSRGRQPAVVRQTFKVAPMTVSQKEDPVDACSDRLQRASSAEVVDMDSTTIKLPPPVSKSQPTNRKGCQLDKGDVGKFLSQTLDLLNTGLNRVLWKTSSTGSAMTSPTLSRRWSAGLNQRRPGSVVSPMGRVSRSSLSLSSMDIEDEMPLDGWDAYEETLQRFGWRQSRVPRMSRSQLGGDVLQQMLTFLGTNLSTDGGQWRASCMVTTYLITLLEKELHRLPNSVSSGLMFVEFMSLGSARKGTKTGRPNEFDILMVLQPTCSSLQEAVVSGKVEGLPAGKTILVTGDTGLSSSKRFVKEINIQDCRKNCLVTRQTVFNAHGLLDSAMAEVAASGRKLCEKVPYRIQKIESKSTFSRITLDTRPISNMGFDVEEIFINITPAICLADGGLQRLPLYAVPDWNQRTSPSIRSLSVPKRNNSVDGDVLWSFCTTALEEAFLATIDKRMKLAGVDSCHVTCLLILKTLFQCNEADGQPTNSEGMSGYWLETVVNFLLLESASDMWTFDKLTNRVSDAIIFFKRALQNKRLPHFLVGNPHLLKQFPYLRMFPWLSGDKQVNLMSGLTEQTAERLVKHVEERTETVPFRHSIRQEFSPDMWEYEFFVF